MGDSIIFLPFFHSILYHATLHPSSVLGIDKTPETMYNTFVRFQTHLFCPDL